MIAAERAGHARNESSNEKRDRRKERETGCGFARLIGGFCRDGGVDSCASISNRCGVVTLSEIGPVWTINQQAKSLKSLAPTLAVVAKFRSASLNVTTPR